MTHNHHPLKTFREKQAPPLTQNQLADLVGVSRTTIARWETGTRRPGRNWLSKLAKKTGIAPAKLRPDLAELMRA